MNRLRLLAACLLGSLFFTAVSAAEIPVVTTTGVENPSSVLLVGNSFFYHNDGVNEQLVRLVRSAEPESKFRATAVTISGAGLDWHDVAAYFRPNALARYSFDAGNNIVFNDLKKNLFDVTIMMDCSQCPIFSGLKEIFTKTVAKDSAIVRRHHSAPVLFMSWAYQDRPGMTQELADAYTVAGNRNHALVIPAGLAFASALQEFPDIGLYAPDKRHPSLAGTYLASCTTYAALFGKSPVGLNYVAGLSPDTAADLQNVAWQTVRSYYGRQ